jgi:hypothetical protein
MTDVRVTLTTTSATDDLLHRVTLILDAARAQVARTVNTATVMTYWLIGRELVEAIQQGEQRAAYGQALIVRLAEQLTLRYGKGFFATNLAYSRQFYLAYSDRILHPVGGQLPAFHPQLAWPHYRSLLRVNSPEARRFYEEAARANWSRRELDRQINSLY